MHLQVRPPEDVETETQTSPIWLIRFRGQKETTRGLEKPTAKQGAVEGSRERHDMSWASGLQKRQLRGREEYEVGKRRVPPARDQVVQVCTTSTRKISGDIYGM